MNTIKPDKIITPTLQVNQRYTKVVHFRACHALSTKSSARPINPNILNIDPSLDANHRNEFSYHIAQYEANLGRRTWPNAQSAVGVQQAVCMLSVRRRITRFAPVTGLD